MLSTVAVTPDSRFIIGGHGATRDHPGHIWFWEFSTGSLLRSDPWSHYKLASIVATPDGRSIVVSGRDDRMFHDGTCYFVVGDIETAAYQTLLANFHVPLQLSLTWDKKYIKFGDFIWNWKQGGDPRTNTRRRVSRREHEKAELTAERALFSTDETFVIKDVRTGQVIREFDLGHDNRYHRFSPAIVTPDGKHLLSQKGNFEFQNMVLAMWAIETGEFVTAFESCKGTIKAIDITGDGRFAVVLAYDPETEIRVLDLRTTDLILRISHERFHD